MSHLAIAAAVFMCVFGCALLGLHVREKLPDHHLSDDSIGVVKLATGLIATLAALVLGLLISSAKNIYDTASTELVQNAAMVIQLDRDLARYGPQTEPIRAVLKRNYAEAVESLASGDSARLSQLNGALAISRSEGLQASIQSLVPAEDTQQAAKAQSLRIVDEIFAARWLTLLQAHGSIPTPLLIVLVAWLSIIFGCFGLFAKANGTVVGALMMCALSSAGAVLMIEELSRPLDGFVKVSVAPMRDTLERMGQ
ncbi:hypothetical protein OKW98_21685 [Pseudomonas sp. KU26590]|uniref:bestrophin-like domain n=1 Tax=Pseudomonas sp. KU26590 TaxID=2991051 RepID=UPI00223D0E94|nr:hypothetical protein [Pseudomonas sp. KU26590]UZJ59145.1 hypothetical protein OKW98_21685 [Pseudomonas sp. KU26590]